MILQLTAALLVVVATNFAASQQCPPKCKCDPREIDCSGVGRTEPPVGLWHKISILKLDNNDISDLYDYSFTGFPSLANLFVQRNHLTVLDFAPLVGLPQLTTLQLGGNAIASILPLPEGLRMENLWSMTLDDNLLTAFDPDVLAANAPTLHAVFFNRNPFTIPRDKPVLNHPMAGYVTFQGTDASAVSPQTFQGLPRLETLIMQGSGVQNISGAFVNNPRLDYADFTECNITEVRTGTFLSNKLFSYIGFANTPLESLELAAISSAMKKGGSLFIQNTPLACSCAFEDIHRWAEDEGIRLYPSCKGSPTCSFPPK